MYGYKSVNVTTLDITLKIFLKRYFLLILLLAFQCNAEDNCDLQPDNSKPELTLFTERWAPYQDITHDGKISGTTVTKIQQVLTAAKWPYKIKVLPWTRALHYVENIPNSFIFSMARFTEREDKYQWVAPLTKVTSKLIRFNNKHKIEINNLKDVMNYTLILKRGEASSIYLAEHNLINKNKVIWVSHLSQAINLLTIGRGQIYPDTITGFNEVVKSSNFKTEQFSYAYDFKELDVNLYLATSLKTSIELVQELSQLFSCYNNSKIEVTH